MRSKALPGWAHTLCTAAAALVFLLAYELVVYRVPVTEIFLPVSSWSDEVIYSKQLAAAVQYGAPQGYFGFNESHAAVGTYAAWGPAVFLVYALPGLLLRGQNAFLWCNLLFVVLGWTFFARAARLGWKRQLAFAAALAAMNAPIRYVFSAMQEPLHYALMLAVLGCGILAQRDKSRAAWAGLCVLCAVATLVRPYEAVLWLFPLALCRQDRRRIAVCVAGGTVSLGGTLVLMSKFYAPYFFTNVDVSPLQELARGQVVSAVRDVAHKLLDALRTVAEMLADQLANRSGGQYLLFFLLLGVTLVCLIVDARAGRPVFWKGCAAVTAVIVFLALLLMYRPVEGSRHTLVLDVLLLAALLVEDARPAAGTAAAALVLAALALAVLAALLLAGGYAARMLNLRVSLLEKICIMLRVVRTQLECCCCPVGDVLGILGSTPDLKELLFIPECIKLCDSEPFPQAWSDSLSARKNTVGLTSSDVSRLVSFGRSLGTTALEGQIANCDMFCADFELRLSEAREKKKKYAKVLPPLGALAGAVIVIAAV